MTSPQHTVITALKTAYPAAVRVDVSSDSPALTCELHGLSLFARCLPLDAQQCIVRAALTRSGCDLGGIFKLHGRVRVWDNDPPEFQTMHIVGIDGNAVELAEFAVLGEAVRLVTCLNAGAAVREYHREFDGERIAFFCRTVNIANIKAVLALLEAYHE